MPFSRLFRSRWAALLWSASILWTAIEVATSTPAPSHHPANAAASVDATGVTVNAAHLAVLAGAGG